jgi:fucose 4-O-acetylase-like acetyltransferase
MRDFSLDNTKMLLIAFVIIGHVIEPIIGRFEWVKALYIYIYLFHMPLFVYVSGVFSSSEMSSKV